MARAGFRNSAKLALAAQRVPKDELWVFTMFEV